jgi:carboxylesterase type B
MTHVVLKHAKLGAIKCLRDPQTIIKVLGLPYGTISQRFARAKLSRKLSDVDTGRYQDDVFDATRPGPSSIQPWGSVKSDASNIPLPVDNLPEDEEQSEDCLNLSIYLPHTCFDNSNNFREDARLPVLVFIHGGAFFLGSANRPYYNPTNFMRHAIERSSPIIFVGINYRLGALGFWHSDHAGDLVPENNGLHDQELAFQWLRDNIGGFGGDIDNVTVIGQSAGGESVSLRTMRTPLFKRAIMFSGTPVTMPAMTHEEHHKNFLTQAEKLGVQLADNNGKERKVEEIAEEVIKTDVEKIRELAWVGLPCTNSSFMPVERPTMELTRKGQWPALDGARKVEAQIVGSTTYDGGISYNMMTRDETRKEHAKGFIKTAQDVLGTANAATLCDIYGIKPGSKDPDALQRVCLFESDIGFFAAALSIAESGQIENIYLHIFHLPNPFPGPIREQGAFATHTFDIVTLLGGAHEERLPEHYAPIVSTWRDTMLDFAIKGTPPCEKYDMGGEALLVSEQGVRQVDKEAYLNNDERRRARLFELAEQVAGDRGCDVLWVDVCRRFLMNGE